MTSSATSTETHLDQRLESSYDRYERQWQSYNAKGMDEGCDMQIGGSDKRHIGLCTVTPGELWE
jgi:hypothetical protein